MNSFCWPGEVYERYAMKHKGSIDDWFLSVVSGRRDGVVASFARGAFTAAEPIYTGVIHARNFLYTRRILKAAHANRPVISVGNVTTGGTGKTPMVAWLVGQLREAGRTPAVLLRGYRSSGGISDEESLLRELVAPSLVKAQPNRFAASEKLLADHPEIDVFVLDDGHQHRQLARYFGVVLVDATSPFGFDHVLPRGLLREPMRAFRRTHAVVITRADLVDSATLDAIEGRIREEQKDVPMFRCNLKLDRVLDPGGGTQSIETLRGRRVFAFCGIGNPESFYGQLERAGAELVGARRFSDHHPYTAGEVSEVIAEAKSKQAELVVTTEKDWVKLAQMTPAPDGPPIVRVAISVEFHDDRGAQLVELVMKGVHQGDEHLGWNKKPTNSNRL
jgi:tetraacyldisaccharide 4'-kinase